MFTYLIIFFVGVLDKPPALKEIIVQVPKNETAVNISWPTDQHDKDCTYVVFWCLSNAAGVDCVVSLINFSQSWTNIDIVI